MYVGMHDRRGGPEEGDRQMIKIAGGIGLKQRCPSPGKFIHPSHDNPARANDIALLRLEEPAVMGKTISPPCLPEQVAWCRGGESRVVMSILSRETLVMRAVSLQALPASSVAGASRY